MAQKQKCASFTFFVQNFSSNSSTTIVRIASPRHFPFGFPMHNSNTHTDDAALSNRSIENHETATDAAIACSRLPVLGRYRQGTTAFVLAVVVTVVNLFAFIGLIYYYRVTSCTTQYGVLPNDFTATGVPPSLAALGDQSGVTIKRQTLVYYQANTTFTQLDGTYWLPFEVTCGCEDCSLASCGETTPIMVEYNQCYPWFEVSAIIPAKRATLQVQQVVVFS